jgi:hypothetical protein
MDFILDIFIHVFTHPLTSLVPLAPPAGPLLLDVSLGGAGCPSTDRTPVLKDKLCSTL